MSGESRQSDDAKPKRRQSAAQLANLKGGSRKGVPNKITSAAKDVIAQAAEGLGGAQRLLDWAKEDPKNETAFWSSIYPRLIPVQVANADGETFRVEAMNDDADAFRRRLLQGAIAGAAASGTDQTQH